MAVSCRSTRRPARARGCASTSRSRKRSRGGARQGACRCRGAMGRGGGRGGEGRGGRGTVLVVEDQAQLRRAAVQPLERAGYKVLAASDGLEALEILRASAEPIHLVFTDVVMGRLRRPGLRHA